MEKLLKFTGNCEINEYIFDKISDVHFSCLNKYSDTEHHWQPLCQVLLGLLHVALVEAKNLTLQVEMNNFAQKYAIYCSQAPCNIRVVTSSVKCNNLMKSTNMCTLLRSLG